jgi:hypothetical protein
MMKWAVVPGIQLLLLCAGDQRQLFFPSTGNQNSRPFPASGVPDSAQDPGSQRQTCPRMRGFDHSDGLSFVRTADFFDCSSR